MTTFMMFTRLSPDAARCAASLAELEKALLERLRTDCPDITWRANLTVHGPWDYVDIFDAPDLASAFEMSTIVRRYGHAHTEVWPAQEWNRLRELVRHIHVDG